MSTADIDKMPRFDEVRKRVADNIPVLSWLLKLERWCRESIEARNQDGEALEKLEHEVNRLEHALTEMRDCEADFEFMVALIGDMDRGIYSPREVIDRVSKTYGFVDSPEVEG